MNRKSDSKKHFDLRAQQYIKIIVLISVAMTADNNIIYTIIAATV